MMWSKVPFEHLYKVPSKNGLNRPSRVRGNGYKMINMGELFANDRIGVMGMERVQLNEREFENMLVEPGDLLFARQSLVLSGAGKCSIVKAVDEPTTYESHLIRVRLKSEIANPDFYRYYFKSPISPIKSIVTQGVQAGIRATDLARLDVHVPPVTTQTKIANILSAYDDLIENNRRRIDLLEQSARLLYKEWFVSLLFPGHEHVKVKDGVPQGWEKNRVGDLSDFLSRGITPSYDDDAPGLVINQKCIREGLLNLKLARHQKKEVPKDKLVRLGDVLVNSTGEGTLGRVAQVIEEIDNCTVDSHVSIVRPSGKVGRYYFGTALLGMESYLSTMGRGATNQTELSRATIADIEILVPPDTVSFEFETIVKKLYSQISNLLNQNEKLQQARDLLLPRLMNGEIPV